MKTAIYTPYLDTASGGEVYMLIIAEAYAKCGSVDILLDDHLLSIGEDTLRIRVNKLHPIDWTNINFIHAPVNSNNSVWQKYAFTKRYDVFFCLSDGSFFYSGAKKSFLHIQMPLELAKMSMINKLKITSWDSVIYNSEFTQKYMKKVIPINSKVIYPPVDVEKMQIGRKQNLICNIGRFVPIKKQDVLIEAFGQMVKQGLQEWELVLIGGMAQGDKAYIEKLNNLAKNLPVRILVDEPRESLIKQLAKTRIYWHAMGYQANKPAETEHFGIAVVEAMASGCVPVVVNAGGLPEIVSNGQYGLLWQTKEELINQTYELIKQNKYDRYHVRERSELFAKERFCRQVLELSTH